MPRLRVEVSFHDLTKNTLTKLHEQILDFPEAGKITIGRKRGNDITLGTELYNKASGMPGVDASLLRNHLKAISRAHGTFRLESSGWIFRDHSQNGTLVAHAGERDKLVHSTEVDQTPVDFKKGLLLKLGRPAAEKLPPSPFILVHFKEE